MSGIRVDRDFVRFGTASYAISKINSIEVRTVKPYKADSAGVALLISVALLLAAAAQGSQGASILCGILAALVFALSVGLALRAQAIEYRLFLMTSSGEARAYVSTNKDEVLALRDKIEDAVANYDRGARR